MEEETIRCDEVFAEGEVMGVSPTSFELSCYPFWMIPSLNMRPSLSLLVWRVLSQRVSV
ncbi:hypothetical protein MKW92_045045 [Papaver armeniacum]|nr:hypothetical protein MKW92_045045 [Papaver armeniacum]